MRFLFSLLVLLVALLFGGCAWVQQSPAMLWYRIRTSTTALYALLSLPEADLHNFLKSYELFDREVVSTEDDANNIVNYYKVLNHLCAVGQVEKMYIPPLVDKSLNIFGNQDLWEEKGMADKLEVGPGKKVLDVGCGRGKVAYHVASYTGAKVVGMNIDNSQVELAKEHARLNGMLGNRLDFMQGNYNNPFPFENGTFDALYQVQALTYAEDLVQLLKEMNRVLKPGAKISFLDWFVLKNFDPNNTHHKKLLKEVKGVVGAVRNPSPEEYAEALNEAGFDIISSAEASTDGGHQYPLHEQAGIFFVGVEKLVDVLTQFRIIPSHIKLLLARLNEGGESLIQSDRMGLFTTSWQIIAQKRSVLAQ